jgi:hypothetical protein
MGSSSLNEGHHLGRMQKPRLPDTYLNAGDSRSSKFLRCNAPRQLGLEEYARAARCFRTGVHDATGSRANPFATALH